MKGPYYLRNFYILQLIKREIEDENMEIKDSRYEKLYKELRKVFPYGHPDFYWLMIKACEIHNIKNKGYGLGDPLGNFRMSEQIGIPAWKGCFIRMGDKWARATNLIKKMNDKNFQDAIKMESIEDTVLDLGVYSFIFLALFKEWKSLFR